MNRQLKFVYIFVSQFSKSQMRFHGSVSKSNTQKYELLNKKRLYISIIKANAAWIIPLYMGVRGFWGGGKWFWKKKKWNYNEVQYTENLWVHYTIFFPLENFFHGNKNALYSKYIKIMKFITTLILSRRVGGVRRGMNGEDVTKQIRFHSYITKSNAHLKWIKVGRIHSSLYREITLRKNASPVFIVYSFSRWAISFF